MSSTISSTPASHRSSDRATPDAWSQVKRILKPLASLRLTVVLLGLSVVLVFLGTVAQVDDSINTVLGRYFYTWVAKVPFQVFIRFGQKFFNISKDAAFPSWFPVWFPYPGGWILGGLLMLNLLAAHTVRFKLSWKRSGIWLIHIGIMLLLLGEFLSSQLKVERRMSIDEGSASNYAESASKVELAIINFSDADADQVAVVPQSRLSEGARITDPSLPVDVEVLRYLPNSVIPKESKQENLATAGAGLQQIAEPRKEVSGVNPSQKAELPSAYLRFYDKSSGKDLGVYLVSRWIPNPQALTVNGETYAIYLRPERTYFPFSLHLNRFRFDRFVGTSTARNYSSDVKLTDPERNQSRELRISMNNPLRYRGETFYQSSFDENTERTTVLQVVHNRAWTMPYLSCCLVVSGLLIHFGMHLNGFLSRRASR